MLFSLDWLLQLCPTDRDVERIEHALTDRGLTVDAVQASGSDHVLDIDVPANRPDCLGHLGMARELSAASGVALARPATASATGKGLARVAIDDAQLCARYTAGLVRDVRVGPSPEWVVRRLESCGLRSVSNVVDASNLVMLELGQPIHFFDLQQLQAGEDGTPVIRVRTARDGEKLRTLDGVERRLANDMLVIADAGRAVALAGVIGGAATEIGPATRHVLIEAAHFDPGSVRSTRRRLGLSTDASYRFERGVDPQAPPGAQTLAARLLKELAGGSPETDIVDVYPGEAPPRTLTLRPTELRRLLGFQPDPAVVAGALDALQLSPFSTDNGSLRVTVPSWRADLGREADLVEEVARHLGYDQIPSTSELAFEPALASTGASLEERARDTLSHLGFHESLGYSMIGAQEDDPFVAADMTVPLELVNPIAEPLAFLRRSIVPGLVRAADLNLRRGSRDVRLFEVGRVFHASPGAESPHEPLRLGLAWSGCGEPRHWSRVDRDVDLYDVIGVTEHLLDTLRGEREWVRREPSLAALHPGRSLLWSTPDGGEVAWGGGLHPEIQQRLEHEVFVLEVALDLLGELPAEIVRQRAVPRVPAVTRDLSLVLRGEVAFSTVLETLRAVPPPAPARFCALDRYRGAPLADGETALTVRVTLEPLEHTLTDAETERYREALVSLLQERLGVRLRS